MLQVFPHFPSQHLKHGWGCLPSPKLRSHRRIWEFPAPFSLSVGTWERAACQGLPLCTQVIIGHKPRQSSAFNYHGREVAQQSETIESGSPETASSGQLTVQLRDITRHLQQNRHSTEPLTPLCPHQTLPAPLDQHWGQGRAPGQSGDTPQSWGAPRGPLGTAQRGDIPLHPPQQHPACSSAGQTPLPCTPQPPGLPPNPSTADFPRLRETFKSGRGRHHVLFISSGRSTRSL